MPAELYEREGIPAPGVASPLDHLSIPMQVVGEAMIKAADPIDEALDEFRSWLKDYKAPELKVVQAEAEPADKCQNDIYQDAEQASTTPTATEFTREKLAEMFDRLRAGTLQDDEWDW